MKNKIALTLIAITLAASAFGQGYHYNNGYTDRNGSFACLTSAGPKVQDIQMLKQPR